MPYAELCPLEASVGHGQRTASAGCQVPRVAPQTVVVGGDLALRFGEHRRPPLLDLAPVGTDPFDQQRGASRRRLRRGVCDLVGNAAIDLVPDACENGDGTTCYGPRQRLSVEGCEVGAGPATANQGDGVDVATAEGPQRCSDRGGRTSTLYTSIDNRDAERKA